MNLSTLKNRTLFAGVFAVGVLVSANSHAGLVLDLASFAPGQALTKGGTNTQTFGWTFSVNSAITIDGLGIWDFGADGIGGDQQIGLWTASGTLLASATVTDASTRVASALLTGEWLFEDIPSLTLTPGNYVVGSTFGPSEPFAQFTGAYITIPEVTLEPEGRQNLADGFLFPDSIFPAQPIFGPTLRTETVQVAGVPEPSTLVVWSLVAGIFGSRGLGKRLKPTTTA